MNEFNQLITSINNRLNKIDLLLIKEKPVMKKSTLPFIPNELVNKIIMLNVPKYPFIEELKNINKKYTPSFFLMNIRSDRLGRLDDKEIDNSYYVFLQFLYLWKKNKSGASNRKVINDFKERNHLYNEDFTDNERSICRYSDLECIYKLGNIVGEYKGVARDVNCRIHKVENNKYKYFRESKKSICKFFFEDDRHKDRMEYWNIYS
jgi:hypothetical protein